MSILKEKIKQFPDLPGVYLMKDTLGGILYVGKSKCLRNRVQSYFYKSAKHSNKVVRLVQNVKDIDVIITDTEIEAFLLECQLIQEIKPVYNKRMKSPESYCYITIFFEHGVPKLKTSIEYKTNENLYFGPFSNRNRTEQALSMIKDYYKINCLRPFKRNRACLNYSLGKCLGMCIGKQENMEDYQNIIGKIHRHLNGESNEVMDDLRKDMDRAIDVLDYEKAAQLRDILDTARYLQNKEKAMDFAKQKQDIIFFERLDEYRFKLFLIKGNKILFSITLNTDEFQVNEEPIHQRIMSYFRNNNGEQVSSISKKEADEAQIVYSYLKNKQNQYLIIKEEWLFEEKQDILTMEVKKFIEKITNLER